MPERAPSHTTGDIAVSEVARIFAKLGWPCERVQQDYGEDLLVQPVINGLVEHHRIWVQVKGTRNISRFRHKNGLRVAVSLDHALKWVRSADVVVVLIWDIPHEGGYWALPLDCVNEWDWYSLKKRSAAISFRPENEFNAAGAAKLGWVSRAHHYNRLVLEAVEEYRVSSMGGETTKKEDSRGSKLPLIVFDFFRLLGVITPRGVSGEFRARYLSVRRRMAREFRTTPKNASGYADILTVLAYFSEASGGLGMPMALCQACADYVPLILNTARQMQTL